MYPATPRVPAGGRAQTRPSAAESSADPESIDTQAPPDPIAALDARVTELGAHVAALTALFEERAHDGIEDPLLARRAADFDAALADEAETQRERSALVAMWTEQRKRDDEITNEMIKMI